MDILTNIVTSLESLIVAIEEGGPYKERQLEFTNQ
jgi:hypothetical protein